MRESGTEAEIDRVKRVGQRDRAVLARSRRFNQTGQTPPGGVWPKENFWAFDTVDFLGIT
jgi:hypothetical protein